MIDVHAWIGEEQPGGRMIMQVHDELVFEVDEYAVDDFGDKVSDIMCNAAALAVPLRVDVGTGANWDEAH